MLEYTIYLAEGCNLKCTYCYEGIEKRSEKMDVLTMEQTLTFIFKNVLKNEKIHIVFLGGEPLLNKSVFIHAINWINFHHRQIKEQIVLEMTSNGILLDEEIMDIVKKEDINLSVSIDGTEQTQMKNRISVSGINDYQTILSNIQKMIQKNIRFNIRMTVTCNNVQDMYNNVCYFLRMGIKRIYLAYDYFADWDEEKLKILDEQMEHLDELYIEKIAFLDETVINLYDFKYTTFFLKRPILFCSAGSISHLVVNTQGEIYPCGYVTNKEEWKMGDVWGGIQGKNFICVARKHVLKKHECQRCEKAFACISARCGFLNFKTTGILNKPSLNVCRLEQILFSHNMKVLKRLYDKRCPRLMEYITIAKEYKLEPNECVKYMME